MPAYNHARFVGFAIESILAQSFADFELLITDDCSSDITYEVICSYDDPRIKAVRQELRSGPSVTINASMRRARGKYIGFCASDDMWLPEKLARQVSYMEAHPDVAALFSKAWFIDAQGTRLPDSAHGQLAGDFGGESFDRRQWLAWLFRNGNCLCAATPLLRADAVRTIGEFDPLMLQLQDYDYWVRLLGSHELQLSAERLVEYRVDSDGANISKGSMAAYARTTYESYRVLSHYADGYAADALAATPLMGEPLFNWQPAAPSRDLLLAQHALECAGATSIAPSHFLFAMDCLHRYGSRESALVGAGGETRLFTLPLFEVTGSLLAQNVLLGIPKTISAEKALIAMQRELDALRAGRDHPSQNSAPEADLPHQSGSGLLAGLARTLGRRKKD
jgi:glycosyltransferase involved in cell wall biosynthesis